MKSLCSMLGFSQLCCPVNFSECDVNVIQQGHRHTGPSEHDGIGRRLRRYVPRRQKGMSYWWEKTVCMWNGRDFSATGLMVTMTETVLQRRELWSKQPHRLCLVTFLCTSWSPTCAYEAVMSQNRLLYHHFSGQADLCDTHSLQPLFHSMNHCVWVHELITFT